MRKQNKVKDFFRYVYYTPNALLKTILPTSGYTIPTEWLFYDVYVKNAKIFDERFYNMFNSFEYYNDVDNFIKESYSNVDVYMYLDIFQKSVYSYLLSNSKRYNELYRVNAVSDDDYMLLNNYDMLETITRSLTAEGKADNTTQLGNQTSTNTDKSAPYDSESFYNDMQRTNTIGAREDSGTTTTDNTENETTTTTKRGNIGVQTGTDMLEKHQRFWLDYTFYDKLFEDIARELLYLVD